jgi:hypothetical protein
MPPTTARSAQPLQLAEEPGDSGPLAVKEIQCRQRSRDGEGVAGAGVPMGGRAPIRRWTEKRQEDALRCERRSHGEIPAGEPLGKAEHVGGDLLRPASEHPA